MHPCPAAQPGTLLRDTSSLRPKHVVDVLPVSLFLGAFLALFLPLSAYAQPVFFMDVCWTGFACMNFAAFGLNLTNALFGAAALVTVAIFLIGAACMVFSAGNDTLLQKGKGMMTGSLIGLAIVLSSYGMWRTLVYVLYAGP